ncbi:C-C chemokine receptor type 4-like [Rhinatrema bivittatum]|uniref:C-C chemokine receptor type 4-like n=1 Tax=Rhinatrema bivittatum TaxID=194408 RepID=UPI00112C020B|nr:C-C chemokine receptor type 4-like [Rhinatrema bivittatum]
MSNSALSEDAFPTEDSTLFLEDYDNATGGPLIYLCEKDDLIKFGSVFVPASYYLIFLLSLTGNSLILFILAKYEKLKTVTNIFILNLVLSDLLFSISLPFWAIYHSSQWFFGNFMCKMQSWIFFMGFYSSVLFLTLMTLDRYLVIVHALSASKARRSRYAAVTCVLVWSVSALASTLDFVFSGTSTDSNGETLCEETEYSEESWHRWKQVRYYMHSILFFLIPLLIVVYCYSRIVVKVRRCKLKEKWQVVKLIFFIVLLFFLCWTPHSIIMLLLSRQHVHAVTSCNSSLDYAYYICRSIAYFHCCVNPFFYTFVGTKFRRHIISLIQMYCTSSQAVTPPTFNIKLSSITN